MTAWQQKVFPRLLKTIFAAALLGSLLFAHGCHGNEDHELLGTVMEWICSK